MSQHDMNLADQVGVAFLADTNAALLALVSNSSGATEPVPTFAYQFWLDTSTGLLKQRNAANSAWITGTHGADTRGSIAMHATTMDLWAQPNIIDGTSTAVTITAIATAPQAGARRTLYPVAGSIITNGATFAVDGAANATAASGDKWEFEAITTSTYKVHITKKDGTAVVSSGGGGKVQDFRLTLTTGVPVTTSDVTGATTIYCTPYKGNQISLYDGAAWVTRASSEFSLALGTLTSGKPYDVFCYDNAGTPTLEFLAWTNDTTRATALAYQDGVLVKSGNATRRYLGTFYTTATTTTEDSLAKRFLWNYYNRVNRPMRVMEATASWTYSTASLRQFNNSTANQLDYVAGVAEDSIAVTCYANAISSAATIRTVVVGIGVDAITQSTGSTKGSFFVRNDMQMGQTATYCGDPGVGRHYITALEQGGGADTQTWYGNSINSGIFGQVMA